MVRLCDDCRACAELLGQADDVLDRHGGTDINQTMPASVEITEGGQLLRCLCLTEKGPLRGYSECCRTPVADTVRCARTPRSARLRGHAE